MNEQLDVGKIVNTHGVRGEVKVMPFTDYPERFEELKWVYVEKPLTGMAAASSIKGYEGKSKADKGTLEKHDIEDVRYFKGMIILKLKGIEDMAQAEGYRNSILKIDRKDSRKLPEGSFLICDLIGMSVLTEENIELGKLSEVLQTGSNDVYVVRRPGEQDLLIPALKSVVLSVNVEKAQMIVRLPEGLLEEGE